MVQKLLLVNASMTISRVRSEEFPYDNDIYKNKVLYITLSKLKSTAFF